MRTSRHPILPPHSVIGGSLNLLLLALLAEKVARRRYMFVLSIVHRLPGLISRRNTIKLTYGVDGSRREIHPTFSAICIQEQQFVIWFG